MSQNIKYRFCIVKDTLQLKYGHENKRGTIYVCVHSKDKARSGSFKVRPKLTIQIVWHNSKCLTLERVPSRG